MLSTEGGPGWGAAGRGPGQLRRRRGGSARGTARPAPPAARGCGGDARAPACGRWCLPRGSTHPQARSGTRQVAVQTRLRRGPCRRRRRGGVSLHRRTCCFGVQAPPPLPGRVGQGPRVSQVCGLGWGGGEGVRAGLEMLRLPQSGGSSRLQFPCSPPAPTAPPFPVPLSYDCCWPGPRLAAGTLWFGTEGAVPLGSPARGGAEQLPLML